MREVFGASDEPSHELDIYDSVPHPVEAEVAIRLFQGYVIDGMNPEKAKKMVIEEKTDSSTSW
jgi:hypothetical protein